METADGNAETHVPRVDLINEGATPFRRRRSRLVRAGDTMNGIARPEHATEGQFGAMALWR